MDRLIWSGEGYPHNRQWLEFFENQSIEQINGLVKAIGNNAIVSGMTGELNAISDGFLIYGNELLPFVSGGNGPLIVIVEEITQAGYDINGTGDFSTILPIWKKRYCKLGNIGDANVVESFEFSILERVDTLKFLTLNRFKVLKRGKVRVTYEDGEATDIVVFGDFTEGSLNGTYGDSSGTTFIGVSFEDLDTDNYEVLFTGIYGFSIYFPNPTFRVTQKNIGELKFNVRTDAASATGLNDFEITLLGI